MAIQQSAEHLADRIDHHDPEHAAAAVQPINSLGYKIQLKQNYSAFHIFGIGFSIMSLMPSIASCMQFAMASGGVGLTWGWLVPGIFIFMVGIALSEMASAFPTSGGIYWWTFKFAPVKYRKPFSWLAGYSSSMAVVGGLCSMDYGFATFVTAILSMLDESYDPSPYHLYTVFALTVLSHVLAGVFANHIMNHMTTFSIVTNLLAIIITVVALPIGTLTQRPLNSLSFVFGNRQNLTQWPQPWTWVLGWQTIIWTVGSYESMAYLAEETANAATDIPFGILTAIGSSVLLGFVFMGVIAACINPDFSEFAINDNMNPMALIYYDCLGKKWAITMMFFMVLIQWFMGLSLTVAGSRQVWAFARDGALPFSRHLKKVSERFDIPVVAMLSVGSVSVAIGSVSLLNETAGESLFSMAIAAAHMAYALVILSRVLNFDSSAFKPGPFYLGHFWSRVVLSIACFHVLLVLLVVSMCPFYGPHPTFENMNYTFVVGGTVWIGAMSYYCLSGHKWYTGPTLTGELETTPLLSDD